MGDIADDMIERMQDDFYPRTRQLEAASKYYQWQDQTDKRTRPQHLPNCKARVAVFDMKAEEPKATPTHIVCSYCQKGGLHWGLDKGKPRLREEGGWIHDCPQVEGVSLSLPDVRTKR